MLTAAQQHAVGQFAKSLSALGDDALIDTYHQAREDHREASAEGSDNLSRAYAKSLATEKAMRDRFPDYQSRYQQRYP
jgi:2-polyprenyl-6-methoxyphenol hydroxylase-like FAD-dependent oxidoreductase